MSKALAKEYFYCYSVPLFKFLKMDKGISFICYALHDKTLMPFWMFEKDRDLKKALKEYQHR
ncbi:hypothetical protein [Paenibacillus polymyxa]|uniref:hypothetical protein n=1 Tax=Paenibacillus polymyxa TaxID=1406 RepID=UPI0032AF9069